jgi:hypothetical protein
MGHHHKWRLKQSPRRAPQIRVWRKEMLADELTVARQNILHSRQAIFIFPTHLHLLSLMVQVDAETHFSSKISL